MYLANKVWPVFEYCDFFFFLLMLMGNLMAKLKKGLDFVCVAAYQNRFAGTLVFLGKTGRVDGGGSF